VAVNATETVVDFLAVARLTRLAQDDEVWPLPELRAAFLAKVGDSRWADLTSCPWCASFHLAAVVALLRWRYPRAWSVLARVLAGSAVTGHLAELSNR
jgi:hypothetical protein